MKMCIWSPGVVFRAWHGKESANLMVCFSCHDLQIGFLDENGNKIGGTGFDFGRSALAFAQLAQQAFPDDPVIQSLESSKEGR